MHNRGSQYDEYIWWIYSEYENKCGKVVYVCANGSVNQIKTHNQKTCRNTHSHKCDDEKINTFNPNNQSHYCDYENSNQINSKNLHIDAKNLILMFVLLHAIHQK